MMIWMDSCNFLRYFFVCIYKKERKNERVREREKKEEKLINNNNNKSIL